MKKTLLALLALLCTPFALRADTLYVTPTGAGAKDGSSWANAFAGIQAAVDFVDAAVAADANYAIPVIRVADGTYSRVSMTNDLALDVRSENGAASTVIDGGGTNACVSVILGGYYNYGQSPKFTGFTLRNGNVRGQIQDCGGGAQGGSFVDCIIEDCQAWRGGGAYGANTMRSIIRRCSAPTWTGGIVFGGNHVNDLMYGCSGNSGLIYGATLYNCTVANNTASGSYYDFLYNSTIRNCILWGNTVNGAAYAQDDASDPKFVGGGDYRLRAGSPAIDSGDNDYSDEQYVGTTDLAGNDRVQNTTIDLGCYEAENGQGLEGVLVLASAEGNGTVSPAHSFVNVGATVTITADTSTWHRDVTTWKTNGVTVANATGNSFTFTATGEQIEIVAQFATLDWFVNGTTGSDTANDGRTAATAFKTIQHAIDAAAPGEQITVAAGVYAPIDASRANVSIIGAGRDTTIIDGGDTTRCANLGERGFSYLSGFTLRNGRHMNVTTDPADGDGGGGAKGGLLYDCMITNCTSTFGGGAFHSEIHRSIIADCSAYDGGGVIMGECFNCLFECNYATQGGAASMASLWGCTVVKNRAVDYAAVYFSSAYSCVFKGNASANGRTVYALQGHGECCFEEEMDDYNVSFTDDPLFVDFENGDYRLREDSPCIDCGWGGVLEDEFDVRGAGYPRRIDALHGEEIADMGCYEGGVTGHVVSVRVDGWGNVSQRTFAVDNGGSATITATTNGRAFQKWLVDGVEAGTSTTLTLSSIDADHVVTACFQRNTTTVTGSGAALQNAIAAAKDGDTLVVADGTYSAIDARGKILTIVSENGPAAAIIRGSSTTRAATLSTSMTHPASTLSGFTIEGGTSTDLRYGGGGVLGGNVSNCVVRGNSAYAGGGVAQAYVTHSIISNNTASVSGGGACAAWLDTCLVVRNAANVNLAGFDTSAYGGGVPSANDNESGGGGIAFSAANFCTITRNTSTTYAGGGMFVVLDNTYFAGNTADQGGQYRQNGDLFPVYPSYVCATSPTFPDADGFVNAENDDSLADPDNGDYTLKATSLCVEGADAADETRRTAIDLDGNPRWRGSAPDIGCYEAAGVLPAAVQGVGAATGLSAIEGGEGVALWWDVTRGAEWYTVHRGTTSNDYASATLLATVQTPTVEFEDFTATAGVDYYYWVVAHSSLGDGPAGASVLGNWVTELVITTPYLPDGLTRETYTTNLTAQGGIAPYTWTVTTPSWLSFSGSTLSGMPPSRGTETVVVTVSDASGQQAERRYDLTINRNPAPLGPATPYAGECYEGNYLIQNYDQLRLFESRLHNEDGEYGSYFEDCTFTVTADIDCGGRSFVPASSKMYAFKGTFDGAGHRIYNFTNDVVGCGSLVGVASSGAVVKNVTLEGYIRLSRVEGTNDWGAAAISEYVEGSADGTPGLTIQNCHFNGSIILHSYYNNPYAGGLVGWSANETYDATNAPPNFTNVVITGCSVNAEEISARNWAGGLVALGWGADVSDCGVTGKVAFAAKPGGLAGELKNSTFRDCSFDGEVSTGRFVSSSPAIGGGGLIGVANGVRFERCAARGLVNWDCYIRHDNFVPSEHYYRTDSSYNFTGCGGAAGVTFGDTAFLDCSFEGTVASTNGFFGGFVGWTAGAETFSNCSVRATYGLGGVFFAYGTAGFAGVVASDGARFTDCSVEYLGGIRLYGGFFDCQTPVTTGDISDGVGSNAFVRCSVLNARTRNGGFCSGAWNCSFKDCSVRGGATQGAGFVCFAGQDPTKSVGYALTSEQTSLFEDCSVVGTHVGGAGFVSYANTDTSDGSALCTNVFRRCRAGCSIGVSSGAYARGFAYGLYKGTLVEDCAAYGVTLQSGGTYGFAKNIGVGATVRRCVGAVLPGATEDMGAGFADSISYTAPVEDCYSVYAPKAVRTSSGYHGTEGGFVQWASVGYDSTGPAITRCFALSAPPDASDAAGDAGSFCGSVNNTSFENFIDCYRPAESAVRDVGNIGDDAGIGALTKAQFASATAATMPNYDFAGVWHAPQGVASSPYLAASTDGGTNFWFAAAVVSGEGSILVNGEAPRESYPIGAVLTVEAVPNGDGPFTGWLGEGFADPLARVTTYTVKNVSAIGATFGTPIYTVEDFLAIPENATDAYVLMNDLDFTEFLSTNTYFSSLSVNNFQGKFFGQGHTLSYACTNCNSTSEAAAPFSSLTTGAELRDLTVESVVSNCFGKAAGLVGSIGNGVLVSNCHARLVATAKPYTSQYYDNGGTCHYYGFAQTVSGTDIRIVDCTADLKVVANGAASGFANSIQMTGGEIARCAVFAEMTATNSYCNGSGRVSGFASDISLAGGATVRECLAAGVADGRGETVGFAYNIDLRDAESSIHDCYSTMEVVSRETYAAGFAYYFADSSDSHEAGVSNLWFGGTVRARTGYSAYGFAQSLSYVNAVNCYRVKADAASSTDGIADIAPAASRAAASWTGFDFDDVWSMTEGATTPYFAWSLTTNGCFRVFAQEDEGTVIAHPATAAPGSNAAIEASTTDDGIFFCAWAGAPAYADAGANPTTFLADNHHAVRCAWGTAISTPEQLAAVADDPAGTYVLAADLDLAGIDWTPLCQDSYTPFTGTFYGNGHTISNLTVDTDGSVCAGLFGRLQDGATVLDLHLVNPVVRGANCVGTLAGYVNGANISGCTVAGADVAATSERAGCFVGQIEGATSVSRCSAVGDIAGEGRYTGGFVGSVEGSAAIEQCYALGSVTGTGGEGFGGFVGYTYGDSVSFSECFACGAVTASERNSVGGFAGYVSSSPAFSDCYALADARGSSYVGGFAGQIYYSDTTFARCYAAGASVGSSDVGGFAGRQYRGSPSFTDCFRPANAPGDVGSADLVGIDALDATGFLDADNFAAYLETGKWSQVDGKTQPYFAWGLQDGKMTLSGAIAGTGDGAITGLGAYEPGTVVQISAVPSGSVFLGWLGNAPYADASGQTTTVPLDNFRIVTAEFGALITTRDQLAAIASELDGSYALGADIDISDGDWTPLGNNSTPFTGSLYAQGHKITGLRVAGTSDYAGLFRCVKDATLDGIHLEGVSVSGRQYTGALAGDVQGATTIRNCSAEGVVTNTYGYAGLLVGRVYGSGTTFDHCAATGTVVAASQDTGGLVGSVYYYPATFADCDADVFVTGTSGNNKGGFIGSVKDGSASATFARCAAWGDVVATNNSSAVGGFIGYANRAVSFEDCSAAGFAGGRGYTGGFAGQTTAASAFARCAAAGDVRGNGYTGGFVGQTSGANSRFEDCVAAGAVVSTSSQTGGFAGCSSGAGTVFADCGAAGGVRSTSSQTGGFVGYVSSSNDLLRCTAAGAVAGTSQTGGFVGQASGDRSQYVECAARGSVSATGYQSGGFVGQIGSTGLRFATCSALGGATSTSYDVGGFVGYVSNSNDLWRCFCAGAATGTYDVGGFAGNLYAANIAVRECFALGDATATRDGDAYAGGFAGNIPNSSRVSDSYCLGTVKGKQKVGGFAGVMNSASIVLTRCYAAGSLDCSGTYAGAFVGYLQNTSATFADCAVLCDGIFAVGTSTAGTSTSLANIAEYDAAGMKTAANFATWLAIDDADGSVWTQEDAVTQPYLLWSAPTGDLTVYASVGGSASGEVQGAGDYAPGATATVTAASDEGFFLRWTGSTPYADPTAATTTIPLDNHRVAAVLFGRLIRTADELDAVRNDLSGIYGLANDIDLAGRDWTPIGFNNAKFTGTLYGFGHAVVNMVCTNSPGTQRHGLFGWTSGATLDGITVSGTVKATAQYTGGLVGCADATTICDCHADCAVSSTAYYTGGLVGAIGDGTAISGCSAAGTVTSTSQYTGGLAGGCGGGTFAIRDSVSTAEVTGGQYTAGFIGYVSCTGAEISGSRADGYAGGNGSVGGFVGSIGNGTVAVSNCVARGDVRSTGSNYGGFVGYLNDSSATVSDCWCSGAVWGTGGTIGSFVGSSRSGTIRNCSIYAYGAGPRPFSGSDSSLAGGSLTAFQIEQLSEGWPEVKQHVHGATKISTAEELFAVTNNLAGIYVLTKDIDLGGAAWTPIGNYSTAFTGEFYGQNHRITGYVVDTTERYAGLFGRIAGGRVSGVVAEGSVTGAYGGSGSDVGVGGFVGKLHTYSLADGCSFAGAVTNATTYSAGGFVGYVCDSPVILRSCVLRATVANNSSQSYAGGFVADHEGGYIMDCYAVADVEAGGRYVGGFAGYVYGRITTSYCSGSVTASGSNHGAFAGSATAGYITKSYYDSGATALLAVNNAAYDGVAPLASAEMLHAANFPAFDFLATWKIDEGATTPYLRTFLVQLTGFQSFLEEYGFDADTDPLAVVNGIPLLARYVYGIVPLTATTDNAGNPLVDILIGADGKPWFKLPPQKSADDYGMRYSVFWSRDLVNWQTLGECYFDQDGDGDPAACHPPIDSREQQMFFKYKIVIED